jgi:hypothetical protein
MSQTQLDYISVKWTKNRQERDLSNCKSWQNYHNIHNPVKNEKNLSYSWDDGKVLHLSFKKGEFSSSACFRKKSKKTFLCFLVFFHQLVLVFYFFIVLKMPKKTQVALAMTTCSTVFLSSISFSFHSLFLCFILSHQNNTQEEVKNCMERSGWKHNFVVF